VGYILGGGCAGFDDGVCRARGPKVIRKTCKRRDVEVIDRLSNVDYIYIFIEYLSKYSITVSFIANELNGILHMMPKATLSTF